MLRGICISVWAIMFLILAAASKVVGAPVGQPLTKRMSTESIVGIAVGAPTVLIGTAAFVVALMHFLREKDHRVEGQEDPSSVRDRRQQTSIPEAFADGRSSDSSASRLCWRKVRSSGRRTSDRTRQEEGASALDSNFGSAVLSEYNDVHSLVATERDVWAIPISDNAQVG
ncbi:hypothetical protein P153DRAFT_359957 [Dothidotthia symphoricarpi CBS 119687]|uniref:Uncharacterized protein n=1 Tax=Dothidotthia symphoricarpi CBS 119687 TaxID=1392245 RepID=A0A6A6A568_9PLEO|nr:uncharacterized protein P153DRAFT_359957 [Dothidotthia symphoricarpi CBS 119687]KAF2126315.1 hypothetical protein P153DRAFT_359957 [Dothidotthia symphoricarpi CBS 119687]